MKLRNKKTGETADIEINAHRLTITYEDGRVEQFFFDSLKDLEDWEDAPEEPKIFYVVDLDGEILPSDFEDKTIEKAKELGNYFETKEEAEKVVKKLKAYKRLKSCGFKFSFWDRMSRDGDTKLSISAKVKEYMGITEDLELLFGGEE